MQTVIIILLCGLFAAGLSGSGSFVATAWGRWVRRFLVPVYLWIMKHPGFAFPVIVLHYLFLLAGLAVVAAFPGGALWLAPVFGVHVGLMARGMMQQPATEPMAKRAWLFAIGGLFVSVLEGGTLLFCAYEVTRGSMDLQIDFFRSLGVFWVIGPVAGLVFIVCGILESLLLWINPLHLEGATG